MRWSKYSTLLRPEGGRVLSTTRCVHRRSTRTTNLLERLFVEERRRLKIIPNGFGEKPVLKLMFGALVRAAERWRGLRFTEFELRQIAAVRKDLDAEYEATRSDRASQTRVSSRSAP